MLAFDTHAYIKELQAVGFTEAQAEAQANTLKSLVENDLVTKRDLKELDTKMEIRFKELDTKIETRSKELELRLTTRLGGMLVIGVAVVATLVKLLYPNPIYTTSPTLSPKEVQAQCLCAFSLLPFYFNLQPSAFPATVSQQPFEKEAKLWFRELSPPGS